MSYGEIINRKTIFEEVQNYLVVTWKEKTITEKQTRNKRRKMCFFFPCNKTVKYIYVNQKMLHNEVLTYHKKDHYNEDNYCRSWCMNQQSLVIYLKSGIQDGSR
eukprot:gene6293-4529_t